MGFRVRLATRHPRFHLVFSRLAEANFPRTRKAYAVWNLQRFQNSLGVREELVVFALGNFLVGKAKHDLFHFGKLMNPVHASRVFSVSTGFAAKTR